MNKIVILYFVLIAAIVNAQEVLFEENGNKFVNTLSTSTIGKTAYTNLENGIGLSFIDKEKVTSFKFNKNYEIVDEIIFFKTEGKGYNKLLASYQGVGNKNILVFSKNKMNSLYLCSIDYQGKNVLQKNVDLEFKGEKPIATFSNQAKFFILFYIKKSGNLKLYNIDEDLNLKSRTIDLNESALFKNGINIKEINSDEKQVFTNYDYLLNHPLPYISEQRESPDKHLTDYKKLFVHNNKVRLLLDSDGLNTRIIEIQLNNYSSAIWQFDNEQIVGIPDDRAISNSFLLRDRLFLLKGYKNKVRIKLYDLGQRKELVTLILDENGMKETFSSLNDSDWKLNFGFKVSQIENEGDFIRKRLKKVLAYTNDVGLYVSGNQNTLLITLVGYDERLDIDQNYMARTYSLSNFLSFYLSDREFTPKGLVLQAYQKMDIFLSKQYDFKSERKTSWNVKFKKNKDYILGYYDKKEKIYFLRKFD